MTLSLTGRRLFVCTLWTLVVGVMLLSCWLLLWPSWLGYHSVQVLVQAGKTEDQEALGRAAEAISKLRGGRPALPFLLKALRSADADARWAAAFALGKLGPVTKEAIPALCDAIQDEEYRVRHEAATALGALGAEAASAVPRLDEALIEEDRKRPLELWDFRRYSGLGYSNPIIKVMARIGDPAVPALTGGLAAKHPEIRIECCKALGEIGPGAADAVPALIQCLGDKHYDVQREASIALGKIGSNAVEPLIAALATPERNDKADTDRRAVNFMEHSRESRIRASAAESLGAMGPAAKLAVPALMDATKDSDDAVCRAAVRALGQIGPESKTAVSRLIQMLKENRRLNDGGGDFGPTVVVTLGQIGPEAKLAVPPLIESFQTLYVSDAPTIAEAILKIVPDARFPLGRLKQAARDPGLSEMHAVEVRKRASDILGRIGWDETVPSKLTESPAAHDETPRLIKALQSSENDEDRLIAADRLAQLGAAAQQAIPALTSALQDPEPLVRVKAAQALWRIGQLTKPCIPVLVEALSSDSELVRLEAIATVKGFGRQARGAFPAVAERLKDENRLVRRNAMSVFTYLGGQQDRWVVATLLEALKDQDLETRNNAAQALFLISNLDAEQVVPAFIDVLSGPDDPSKWGPIICLGKFGPAAKEAVPALTEMLRSEHASLREYSAKALGRIGPDANSAVPALLNATKDSDEAVVVVVNAAEALAKIDPADDTTIPVLVEQLKNWTQDSKHRSSVADALGELGPRANAAVAALEQALDDDTGIVSVHAASALWRIDGRTHGSLPRLIAVLRGEIHEPQPDHVQGTQREQMQLSLDRIMRQHAINALSIFGRDALPAAPTLVELLQDSDLYLRSNSAVILGHLGLDARFALPALAESLDDEHGLVRARAAEALWRIDHQVEPGVRVLAKLLRDPGEDFVRVTAAKVLGDIGPPAAAAISALRDVERSDRTPDEVRAAVAEAIQKITREASESREP